MRICGFFFCDSDSFYRAGNGGGGAWGSGLGFSGLEHEAFGGLGVLGLKNLGLWSQEFRRWGLRV